MLKIGSLLQIGSVAFVLGQFCWDSIIKKVIFAVKIYDFLRNYRNVWIPSQYFW